MDIHEGHEIMHSAILKRFHEDGCGTFGVLSLGPFQLLTILEPPWHWNERNISCIPTGNYRLKYKPNHDKYGETWQIVTVPDRDPIFFHVGNILKNTRGCPLVGMGFGFVLNTYGITGSNNGMNALRMFLGDADDIPLSIVNCK